MKRPKKHEFGQVYVSFPSGDAIMIVSPNHWFYLDEEYKMGMSTGNSSSLGPNAWPSEGWEWVEDEIR